MKSSVSDPHKRIVSITDVHVFTNNAFVSKFFDTNIHDKPIVTSCLNEHSEVFLKSNIAKFHSSGDISLITPWSVVLEQKEIELVEEGKKVFLEAGSLLLQINKTLNEYFVPCGGLDEDNTIPNWCSEIDLRKLLPGLKPEDVYPLKKAGD